MIIDASIIVAIIGALVTVGTFAWTKHAERDLKIREIKESQYIDFLESIAQVKRRSLVNNEEALDNLSAKIQTIYLVGNIDVQTALSNYLNLLRGSKPSDTAQDKLYCKLIEAMKRDLYGKRTKTLETISFTIINN